MNGAVVSNDFPAFCITSDRLDPRFLGWYAKTEKFVNDCKAASEGTTNRVRLKEDRFLRLTIGLPPVKEQVRIVQRIERFSEQIVEIQKLRKEALGEGRTLLRSALHKVFVSDESDWPLSDVGSVADIIDPNPSHRMPHYADTGIPFISTVDFEGPEGIRRRTAKYVTEQTYAEQASRCSFAVGDIIYSRIGTIGEARLLNEIWPFALSHVLVVVKTNPKLILPRFLLWYLRSDSIVGQADVATRSIGVPDLGIKRIRQFHLPLPGMDEQKRIVAYLDGLQALTGSAGSLQLSTDAEIRSLMPSILNQAFSGNL
jgi:type I restriction enzyme S subunit